MDGRVVEESPLPSYPTAHDPFLGQACTLLSHFSPKVAHGHASDPFCRCEMSSARSPSTPTPRLERRSPSRPRCADILLQQRPWYATYSRACLAPLFARATHERLHPHVSALRLTDVSASRRSQSDASVFTAALFASSAAAPRRSDADADADSSGSRRGRVLHGIDMRSDITTPGSSFQGRHAGLFSRQICLSVVSTTWRVAISSNESLTVLPSPPSFARLSKKWRCAMAALLRSRARIRSPLFSWQPHHQRYLHQC